jgi:hypothetical protein
MVLKGSMCNLKLVNGKIDELIKLAEAQDGDSIKEKLKTIVPEYMISTSAGSFPNNG